MQFNTAFFVNSSSEFNVKIDNNLWDLSFQEKDEDKSRRFYTKMHLKTVCKRCNRVNELEELCGDCKSYFKKTGEFNKWGKINRALFHFSINTNKENVLNPT